MPADIQLDPLPDFVCKVEELALDFHHWSSCVLANEGGQLRKAQKSLLRQLGDIFDEMSGGRSQGLWAEDALRSSHEWQRVRDVAAATLGSFAWEIERPPSYQHEYVSGANI